MSRANFERRIEELKQDSNLDEQDDLLKGIYAIREFCLDKQSNIFVVEERMLKQNSNWRALFNRLMDYRIINNCATALTQNRSLGLTKHLQLISAATPTSGNSTVSSLRLT